MTKKAGRRSFGSIVSRPGREGFYLAWSHRGRRYWRRAGLTRKEAERKARTLQVELDRGTPHDEAVAKVWGDTPKGELTFRQAVKGYLASAQPRLKESTFYQMKYRLRKILQAAWGDAPLASISAADIERWRIGRQKGRAPSTVNRDVDGMAQVFEWAKSLGFIPSNPAREVKAFSERHRQRKTFLTIEESGLFLQAAQDEGDSLVHRFLTVAHRTGARRGELLGLEWRDVDFDRAEMTIRPEISKSGETRIIPLGGTAIATFRELRGGEKVTKVDGTGPVFSENGRTLTIPRLRYRFERIKARLEKSEGFPCEKLPGLVLHSLRHTFISLGLQAGVDIWTMQKWAGHSTVALTSSVYGHFAVDKSKGAMDTLDRALDGGDKTEKKGAEGGA